MLRRAGADPDLNNLFFFYSGTEKLHRPDKIFGLYVFSSFNDKASVPACARFHPFAYFFVASHICAYFSYVIV